MELLLLVTAVCSLFALGFFWAYERIGPTWSSIASLICVFIVAIASAFASIEQATVQWEIGFNVLRISAFCAGYTLGYPFKKIHYKKVLVIFAVQIIILLFYLTAIVTE